MGLPSNPSSRKGSIFDLTQQQQQHQLPMGIGNSATSPPSDDEEKRFKPKWKGSGSNLPPQTAKQALSMLKQASSATNVSQGVQERQYYLGGGGALDSPKNLRKGSMYNLKSTESPQRKGSIYAMNVTDASDSPKRKASVYAMNVTDTNDSPKRKASVYAMSVTDTSDSPQRKASIYTMNVTDASDSPQRKASVYSMNVTDTSLTSGARQRKGSMYVTSASEAYDSPESLRKNSVMNLSTTDSPSMLRKQSIMVPPTINTTVKHQSSLSDSSSNLSSTVSSTVSGISTSYGLQLGPGQIHPKGYRLITERHGELKMGFNKIKGTVEVEVSVKQPRYTEKNIS